MIQSAYSFTSRRAIILTRAATTRKSNAVFSRHGFFQTNAAHSSSLSSSALSSQSYDVIVIGGGHAGTEAATASARTGARTLLVTQNKSTLGELSCNPSIGGIGKGHLVREIDALNGVMGTVADASGIHFRMLNRRKGPAVRGPRAQMDRDMYKENMQHLLLVDKDNGMENLEIMEASVDDLLLDEGEGIETLAPLADPADVDNHLEMEGGSNSNESARSEKARALSSAKANESNRRARIRGVVAIDATTKERIEIESTTVVLTTGTFLRGVLMIGHERYSGGRHLRDSEEVEPPSVGLALTLERFGFPLGRLKTGTPARLDGRTIDWDACKIQPSERPAVPFSYVRQSRGEEPPLAAAGNLIDCYQTATNEETHKLVMEYAHLLPEYDGMDGKGNGPRYCPSIYKKVERFAERKSHNSFLEPEGLNTDIVYPNGMSGPYPEEIQLKIFRSMMGLEKAEIVRPGYDVEYDFVNPQVLTHTLEAKSIAGLYLAGQICGTTGYEEAGAQGIIAGANAGRAAGAAYRGEKAPVAFVLGRDEAYIGVLIDDLVTKGTTEPYRMFTSRAEYRISLRADNADLRLTRKGAEYGLVTDPERLAALDMRQALIGENVERLRDFKLFVTDWGKRGGNDLMGGAAANRPGKEFKKKTAEEVLGMPNVSLKMVESIMADVFDEEQQEKQETADGESSSSEPDVDAKMDPTPLSVYDTVEASIKYKSYVVRQEKDIESWRKAQGAKIPPNIIYDRAVMPTFKQEEIEKLDQFRPSTFAEASQISALRPQSLVYLYHHVMRLNKESGKKKREESESCCNKCGKRRKVPNDLSLTESVVGG
eukprot:CAMPEP_0201876324 /NCGR_PEP_ID=MMETSP0902-20130614/8038_1 /ASSEMBLY_ACC=CAM_ASM_000551 /TAXON_ID=420261 /ORGANISM="Thalassiosira antarctica, Strain CCMP982" /LENGTH=826 /DNA_ID=CAMNT_0048403533 /DNA_START=216 /DNA_END=2692 /DNA_ORIENTATION=-